MHRLLTAILASSLLIAPQVADAATKSGAIVIEGRCPDGQHENLQGTCVCHDARMKVVDQECVIDDVFAGPGIFDFDVCTVTGSCDGPPGGGGGSGGGGSHDPIEPEEDEEDAQCQADYDACASDAFEDTQLCPGDAARARCAGGTGGMTFPGGAQPACRIVEKSGRLFCTFPDSLQHAPFVGTPGELYAQCQDAWIASGELDAEIRECEQREVEEMEACQEEVQDRDECFVISFLTTASEPDPLMSVEPAHEMFLRTKLRTRGETAIDAEALVRNGTRDTCYWHLRAHGDQLPEGTLYCGAGDGWKAVGDARFQVADGDAYLADGHCGIATPDGFARGEASYRFQLQRDGAGAPIAGKVRSVAGRMVGSLDGLHPYWGDCRMSGRMVPDAKVPASLLAQLDGR